MLISSFWRWTYKKTFYFSINEMTSIIPSGTWLLLFLLFYYCSVRIDCLLFSINQFYGISFYFDFWSSRRPRQNELSTDPGSFAFLEAKIITSILQSWSFKMGYHMTFLVKYCFIFVFFGHPAPVLRVIKMTLGNLDIWKIVWMLSQVSIGVKYVNKLIIPLYIFKASIFDSTRGSFFTIFPFFPIYV